jgi:hypothetical protein
MSQKNSLSRVKAEVKDGMLLVFVDNKVVYKELAKLTKKEQILFADCKRAIKKICKPQKIEDPEHHVQYVVKATVFCLNDSDVIKFSIKLNICAFRFINLPSSLNWLQTEDVSVWGIEKLFLKSKEHAAISEKLNEIEKKVNTYTPTLKNSIYREYCYL